MAEIVKGRLMKLGGWMDVDPHEYVRASDYEALRQRFEKACGEVTRLSAVPEVVENAVATVEKTCVGPKLFVNGVFVHWWLGTMHDEFADKLAAEINASRSPRGRSE